MSPLRAEGQMQEFFEAVRLRRLREDDFEFTDEMARIDPGSYRAIEGTIKISNRQNGVTPIYFVRLGEPAWSEAAAKDVAEGKFST